MIDIKDPRPMNSRSGKYYLRGSLGGTHPLFVRDVDGPGSIIEVVKCPAALMRSTLVVEVVSPSGEVMSYPGG